MADSQTSMPRSFESGLQTRLQQYLKAQLQRSFGKATCAQELAERLTTDIRGLRRLIGITDEAEGLEMDRRVSFSFVSDDDQGSKTFALSLLPEFKKPNDRRRFHLHAVVAEFEVTKGEVISYVEPWERVPDEEKPFHRLEDTIDVQRIPISVRSSVPTAALPQSAQSLEFAAELQSLVQEVLQSLGASESDAASSLTECSVALDRLLEGSRSEDRSTARDTDRKHPRVRSLSRCTSASAHRPYRSRPASARGASHCNTQVFAPSHLRTCVNAVSDVPASLSDEITEDVALDRPTWSPTENAKNLDSTNRQDHNIGERYDMPAEDSVIARSFAHMTDKRLDTHADTPSGSQMESGDDGLNELCEAGGR